MMIEKAMRNKFGNRGSLEAQNLRQICQRRLQSLIDIFLGHE